MSNEEGEKEGALCPSGTAGAQPGHQGLRPLRLSRFLTPRPSAAATRGGDPHAPTPPLPEGGTPLGSLSNNVLRTVPTCFLKALVHRSPQSLASVYLLVPLKKLGVQEKDLETGDRGRAHLPPPPFLQARQRGGGAEKGQHGDGSLMGRVPSLYIPGGPLGKVATLGSRASSRSVAPSMLDRCPGSVPQECSCPPDSTQARQVGRQPCPWLSSHPRRRGRWTEGCASEPAPKVCQGLRAPLWPTCGWWGGGEGGPAHWSLDMWQLTTNTTLPGPAGLQSPAPVQRPHPLEWHSSPAPSPPTPPKFRPHSPFPPLAAPACQAQDTPQTQWKKREGFYSQASKDLQTGAFRF